MSDVIGRSERLKCTVKPRFLHKTVSAIRIRECPLLRESKYIEVNGEKLETVKPCPHWRGGLNREVAVGEVLLYCQSQLLTLSFLCIYMQ